MPVASMTQVSNPCPGHKITKYLIFGAASFDSRAMTTVAITNRKGGVGKSSLTTNLAAALALEGKRVLVIDMDSQASSTAVFLDELPQGAFSTAHVLIGQAALEDIIVPSTREGVFIAPASRELTAAQLTIVARTGRETILRRAMRSLQGYDLILIDTAPEQQLATVNSLVAATHVLMPFTPDPKALEGLRTTSEAVAEIAAADLGQATVLGCVQIAHDRRLAVTEQAREQVRKAYGEGLLETRIRANSSFIVCPAWHRDIFAIERGERAPRRGSDDYRALAIEIAGRLGWKEISDAQVAV
jgi:chromosome partitioning protein